MLEYELVDSLRDQETIAIAGRRSKGKTLLASYLTFQKYLEGSLIFSNIWLNFPHTRIHSLDDLKAVYSCDETVPKCFLCDDIERYLHARAYSSKMNKLLNDILLDFGKISCSMIMTMKQGPLNEGKSLDVSLRDAVDMWYYPMIYQYYHSKDRTVDKWLGKKMNFKRMKIICIDGYLLEVTTQKIKNLMPLLSLYNTREKVDPLIENMNNPYLKGDRGENFV